jgi:hypothetical protein
LKAYYSKFNNRRIERIEDPLESELYNSKLADRARMILMGDSQKIHARAIYLPETITQHLWQSTVPSSSHPVLTKIPFIDTEKIPDSHRPADSQSSPRSPSKVKSKKRPHASVSTGLDNEDVSVVIMNRGHPGRTKEQEKAIPATPLVENRNDPIPDVRQV